MTSLEVPEMQYNLVSAAPVREYAVLINLCPRVCEPCAGPDSVTSYVLESII